MIIWIFWHQKNTKEKYNLNKTHKGVDHLVFTKWSASCDLQAATFFKRHWIIPYDPILSKKKKDDCVLSPHSVNDSFSETKPCIEAWIRITNGTDASSCFKEILVHCQKLVLRVRMWQSPFGFSFPRSPKKRMDIPQSNVATNDQLSALLQPNRQQAAWKDPASQPRGILLQRQRPARWSGRLQSLRCRRRSQRQPGSRRWEEVSRQRRPQHPISGTNLSPITNLHRTMFHQFAQWHLTLFLSDDARQMLQKEE